MTSGLFWRTFFLLAFLIAVSMAAWIGMIIRIVQRSPRADQIAAQVVSDRHHHPFRPAPLGAGVRRELLFDLASNEGIRVYPREASDKVDRRPRTPR